MAAQDGDGSAFFQGSSQGEFDFMLPQAVKVFLRDFYASVKGRDVQAAYGFYANEFKSMSQRYFNEPPTPWPSMETVAPFCENDRLFLHLYAELYYRHLYVIGQHSLRDMIDSWRNWCALFEFLIESPESAQYVLPLEWLYDIINEYVYQFQSFCQLRNKVSTLAAEDMEALLQNEAAWSPQTVIETLGALTKAARVKESISGKDTGVKSQPLATLGYFAMIGKARVHIVLGDYRMVLASLMPIQLFEQGLFTRVTACHIMIYYCAGFAYMMLRRYVDASACFRRILIFLSRTKNYQKREIQKKHDQIVALLAITSALCPGVQIEGSVRDLLNEQHGDKLPRLQAGQLTVYKDLFNYACPKFISPNTPAVMETPSAYSQTAKNMQCNIFLEEVKQRVQLATGTSYLKLYTMASMSKLAQLREMDEAHLRRSLMYIKNKMRSLTWESGEPLAGAEKVHLNPNFFVHGSSVKVEETTETSADRNFGKYFINESVKFQDIITRLSGSS